jgi:hypothetical protein
MQIKSLFLGIALSLSAVVTAAPHGHHDVDYHYHLHHQPSTKGPFGKLVSDIMGFKEVTEAIDSF